jgi:hypothetical protein
MRMRDILQRSGLDAAESGRLFGELQAIRRELEAFRSGAQTRTLEEAGLVASLDTEFRNLPAPARNAAVMARTGFKRTKLYRLRQLRRPVLNGNPDPNGTLDR